MTPAEAQPGERQAHPAQVKVRRPAGCCWTSRAVAEDLPFSAVIVVTLSPPGLASELAYKHSICLNSELTSTAISGGETWCFQASGSNPCWQQDASSKTLAALDQDPAPVPDSALGWTEGMGIRHLMVLWRI